MSDSEDDYMSDAFLGSVLKLLKMCKTKFSNYDEKFFDL